MGRTYSKNERQYVDQTLHREATKKREEIKRTTKQKMARRHNKEGGNHLEEESNRQKTTEDINGRRTAISRSGWTKPRWKVNQESNKQRTMEDIDGGLHPAVDGQSLGERWNRKATDRRQRETLTEGLILQWMGKAQVKDERWFIGAVFVLTWLWYPARDCRTTPALSNTVLTFRCSGGHDANYHTGDSFSFSSRWHRNARKGPCGFRSVSQQSPQGCPRNSANVCGWTQIPKVLPSQFGTVTPYFDPPPLPLMKIG